MGLITYIIFGGIVGWVASIIMGTDAQQGIFLNIVVGVIGALLGSWLVSFFGASGAVTFSLYGFLVALIGAVVLLALVRMFRGRRTVV